MSEFREEYRPPAVVLNHARRVRATIAHQRNLLSGGGPVPAHLDLLTRGEAERQIAADLAEHEREATLAFIASVEGLLRHDLSDAHRPKGELHEQFRRLRKTARREGNRPVRLAELFEVWKSLLGNPAGAVGQFGSVLVLKKLARPRSLRRPPAGRPPARPR